MLPKNLAPATPRVYMATLGSQRAEVGFDLLGELRRAGIAADMDFERPHSRPIFGRLDRFVRWNQNGA
jgi:hypothetical protein